MQDIVTISVFCLPAWSCSVLFTCMFLHMPVDAAEMLKKCQA
jgi:hypothetical protein